ncbi:DUF2382 domain-containing protein [uncultured Pseudokineococcus sp.]|uniref:DUF2382 domain-containing protein n=1 Tax=uncultured Pseudokineococcus sp. TaxID=1642928 RepID=UPI002602FC92|nr:DUF2382 domain-containing protein [uncultured Pseudokineococcus sp.]
MTATGEGEGRPRSSGTGDRSAAGAAEVVLSEERAVARRLRVPVERVRVAKRIRTETVRVEVDVEVRREELVVTSAPVPPEEGERLATRVDDAGAAAGEGAERGAAPAGDERVVLVLSEEVPVVGVETRAAERVTVAVRRVEGVERVVVDLDREVVDVDGARGAPAGTSTTDQHH